MNSLQWIQQDPYVSRALYRKHAQVIATACLATARLEGPVLAPEALRTAELSQPVLWPGLEYCSV